MSKLKNLLKRFGQGYNSGVRGVGKGLNKLNRPTNPNFLKRIMPYEYSRTFQKKQKLSKKQLKAKNFKGRASSNFSRLPPPLNLNNKFIQKLMDRQRISEQMHQERMAGSLPQDFFDRVNAQRMEQARRDREFSQANNIMKARFAKVDMNFLDTQNAQNILRSQNIMQKRPDSIDLNKTNRPSVLNTRESGNDLKF
jgi:hypothetical protein